jgi:glucokinase
MPRSGVTIGVDLGGTKLLAAVVGAGGRVSSLRRWPGRVSGYHQALDTIAELVGRLRREVEGRGGGVTAVGVAIAAFLTADRDGVRDATNLMGWRDRPVRADLHERLGLPVVIENDADAAVWGEYVHGAGRGERCVVMATVGTGIGGGIVVGGELVRGGFGLAGEFGHLVIVPDGRLCGCGSRGCLEAYASGTALTDSVRAAAAAEPEGGRRLLDRAGGDPDRIDGPMITALALDGDPMALRGLDALGGWLGRGLAQVATVLDPSLVLIGGGLAEAAGELIVGPARTAYGASLSIRDSRPVAPMRLARLGNTAGLVGAGALASAMTEPSERAAGGVHESVRQLEPCARCQNWGR